MEKSQQIGGKNEKSVDVSNKPGVQSITMTRINMGGGGMMNPMLAYGPYDDVVTMPMAASYNPLLKTSEYCSSCHQDGFTLPDGKTWDVESVYPEAKKYPLYEKGRVIPNQWTYQEWFEWQSSLPDGDEDKGNINVPIWRTTKIISDNRIKSKEVDTSSYSFQLPEGWREDDSFYVTATLIYRAEFRNGGSIEPKDILMKEKTVETGNGEL